MNVRPQTRWLALVGLLAAGTIAPAQAAGSQARQQAAAAVAAQDPQCRSLGDFYWEIGDVNGAQGSGVIGGEYTADTSLRVASASKFVWGAYVLEKIGRNNQPTPEQVASLEMRSGYAKFNPLFCALSRSVDACMSSRSNGERDSGLIGKFSYGGGHDQRLAGQLGLGRLSARELTDEVTSYVGKDIGFSYRTPLLAGGMESTPAQFATFLRKVISGQLRLKQFLGYQPVCTQCASAAESPAREPWHYSLNHWIEDTPGIGDGAFSSPGAMGFYPWISQDKTTYGILARQKMGAGAYWDSVLCGRKIRKAWMEAR